MARQAGGHELVHWSMPADMPGFYLLLLPLALVLRDRLRSRGRQWADLSTLCGLGYLLCGAAGAAILGAVLPSELAAHAAQADPGEGIRQTLFLVLSRAIYDGVWGTLNPLLGDVWWVGTGLALRSERRAAGWGTIVLGAFMLLREIRGGQVELLGIAVYFGLAPIWAAWMGVDTLLAGARRKETGR